MVAGVELAALLPEIWAASVAVFSQDRSSPDVVLSCGVEWAEAGRSCWEMNCCIPLPRACLPEIQYLAPSHSCGATRYTR